MTPVVEESRVLRVPIIFDAVMLKITILIVTAMIDDAAPDGGG